MSKNSDKGFRLPSFVVPETYELKITPNFDEWTFQGEERVGVVVSKVTKRVVLHAFGLDISDVSFCQKGAEHKATNISFDATTETVTCSFPVSLKKGSAELCLHFGGRIRDDQLVGFYRSRYELPNGTQDFLATTQFEGTYARRACPCWDEPAFKAVFRLTLCIPEALKAISNADCARTAYKDGKKIMYFSDTPRMSTYLLAFAVGKIEGVYLNTKNATRVSVQATPGKIPQCMFALGVAVNTMEYLESYFGVRYPLPKLDLLAVPDFASGAMENWGLVTFRERILLFDHGSSSLRTKQVIAAVVAHELVHQWFGNLVTMQWWNDLWLNESFASFMGDKVVASLYPEWNWWEEFYSSDTARAFALDALQSTHSIEVPVADANQIGEIFDAISYSKGASVLRMLEHYIGESAFRNGLKNYLSRHAYSNTTTADLWTALSGSSGKDVGAMMDTWTKQPGFPLIRVADEGNGHRVSLRVFQKRFFASPDEAERKNSQIWQVPVEVETARGRPVCALIGQEEEHILLPRQARRAWIKVNPGHAGFYRVEYDECLLRSLYPAIASGDLPAIDRLGMHNDLWALTSARYIPAHTYLDALPHFAAGEEYALWSDMGGSLAALVRLLEREPYVLELEAFARGVFLPRARKLGWDAVVNEPDLETLLRPVVLALLGRWNDYETIVEAERRYGVLVDDPASVAPNLQAVVCGIAARTGTADTREYLLRLYRAASSQEQKVRYLGALGSFREARILEQSLAMCLSGDVRLQDVTGLLLSAASANRDATWQFVKDHWEALSAILQGDTSSFRRMVNNVVPFCLTAKELEDTEAFFAEHPVPEAERALAQAFETVRKNIAWIEANREPVGKWLGKKVQS